MKVSTFLIVVAVVYGLFGLGTLFAPGQVFAPMGITLDASGQLIARTMGATMIGFAVIFWQARKATNSPALRAILLGNAIYLIVEIVVTVSGTLSGIGSSAAWGGIVVDLLLLVGFAYFYFQLARSSATQ